MACQHLPFRLCHVVGSHLRPFEGTIGSYSALVEMGLEGSSRGPDFEVSLIQLIGPYSKMGPFSGPSYFITKPPDSLSHFETHLRASQGPNLQIQAIKSPFLKGPFTSLGLQLELPPITPGPNSDGCLSQALHQLSLKRKTVEEEDFDVDRRKFRNWGLPWPFWKHQSRLMSLPLVWGRKRPSEVISKTNSLIKVEDSH